MSKPGSDYYKGAFRYIINGCPCRFPRELSKHALAVAQLTCQSVLRSRDQYTFQFMAAQRFPETTYAHGGKVFHSHVREVTPEFKDKAA